MYDDDYKQQLGFQSKTNNGVHKSFSIAYENKFNPFCKEQKEFNDEDH